jgi:curved DNA-binding protein CbpA
MSSKLSVKELEALRILSLSRANLYDVLGLSCEASENEIKLAYRKLALRFHPDKNNSASTPSAEKAFKAVSLASTCLSDPLGREQYDMTGSSCGYDDQAVAYSRAALVDFCNDIVVPSTSAPIADAKAPAGTKSGEEGGGAAAAAAGKTRLEDFLLLYLQELAAADADSHQEYRAALAAQWSPPLPPPPPLLSVPTSHRSTPEALLSEAGAKSEAVPGSVDPSSSPSNPLQSLAEAAHAQGLRRDSAVGKLLQDQRRTGMCMAILAASIVFIFFWSESYYCSTAQLMRTHAHT